MSRLHTALNTLHDLPPGMAVSRALVADDDRELCGLLATWLSAHGMQVDTATSGKEALKLIREAPPDIAILDVEMPGLTGFDVLALVREQKYNTAVVMTTSFGSEDVVIEALRLGADDYLRKPFDRAGVLAVLDRTTRRLELSRQIAALRRQVDEHNRRIDEELASAARVVGELLPPAPPQLAGFEIAATCLPARELGGDFYDWQHLASGALSLTVGDVMGKGLSAALLMATVRGALRTVSADSPAEVVQRAAAALDGDLSRSGAFVTLFHAHIDLEAGRIRYVDAGHGYVVLCRADGRTEDLKPWGLPLGVDSGETYHEGVIDLQPGDSLIVYSDGLAEARPDLFTDRRALGRHAAGADAANVVCELVECATQFTPLPDDLTVVVLRRSLVEELDVEVTPVDEDQALTA